MNLTKEQEAKLLKDAKAGVSRHQGLGARREDLLKIHDRIPTMKDWRPQFTALAQQYEKLGDDMVAEESRMVSYLTAASYHHIGELLIFADTKEKMTAFKSFEAAYLKAAKFFPFPLERVEIPFGEVTLPGYYRRVTGIKKAPAVILVRGVDACREVQLHIISNHFLRQGFFTLSVDLPGQGQARMRGLKMTSDFEKPVGAVVDYLAKKPEINTSQIGILGISFGGFIAPRAAALEKRIKACISMGGFYGLDEFEFTLSAKLNCFNNMGISSEAEWQKKRKEYSLETIIGNLTRPLLVVNGSEDKVIPASQSVKMYDKAPGPKELKIYEGLGHCVYHEKPEILADMALWMKEKLSQ